MNLFEARADWPIPPTTAPTQKPEKTEVPPQIAVIPLLWFCPNKFEKNVHEDCTAPSAKRRRKMAWRFGMVIGKKISQETTIHQTCNTPNPMMSLTDTQNRSG